MPARSSSPAVDARRRHCRFCSRRWGWCRMPSWSSVGDGEEPGVARAVAWHELRARGPSTARRRPTARRGAPLPRRRPGRSALERVGEPAARRRRGACGRDTGRRDQRSAECRKWCTTTRTGCSCLPNDPRRARRRDPSYPRRCDLRDRLAAGAQPSVAAIGREPIYSRLEGILRGGGCVRPRVLFVGRSRHVASARRLARRRNGMRSAGSSIFRVLNDRERAGGDDRFVALPDAGALVLCRGFRPRPRGSCANFRPDVIIAIRPVRGGRRASGATARAVAREDSSSKYTVTR